MHEGEGHCCGFEGQEADSPEVLLTIWLMGAFRNVGQSATSCASLRHTLTLYMVEPLQGPYGEVMPHFFFDTRDNDTFIVDDVGIEFPDLASVKKEAARSLAELGRDVLPGSLRRELAVEVRDALGPVMRAIMTFEAIILRPALAAE
jgi:hypothetical protein